LVFNIIQKNRRRKKPFDLKENEGFVAGPDEKESN